MSKIDGKQLIEEAKTNIKEKQKMDKINNQKKFTIKQIVVTTVITIVIFLSGIIAGVSGYRMIDGYIDSQVDAKVQAQLKTLK